MTVAALVLALAPPATPEPARRYVALPSTSPHCNLEIDSAERSTLDCRGRPQLKGTVDRVNNWFVLDAKPVSLAGLERAGTQDQEYRAAFQSYMRQHFMEHGFYPLIAPPPLANVPETTGCIMVSVEFRRREYLVDLFERDAFCRAAGSGLELRRTASQHRVFRRRDARVEPHSVPYDVFCGSEWRPLFE